MSAARTGRRLSHFVQSMPATAAPEGPTWKERIKKWARTFFTIRTLKRYFPITVWLPEYNLEKLQCDVIAGITTGLTVIPQGIAYASVAGLPLQYGLYSAFMSCFVYCIFGTRPQASIGPTAIMALLTEEDATNGGPPYAILLCFITGVVEFLFGVFNLGFLVDFISSPVISGFSSAAAIIIAATQIKGLLGLEFHANGIVDVIENVIDKITETKHWNLVLGIGGMVILLTLRWISKIKWDMDKCSVSQKCFSKLVWIVCTGRNALVVIISSLIAYFLVSSNQDVFLLTGNIKGGLPDFKPPEFTRRVGNTTMGFDAVAKDLGASIGLLPLLAILEHIAICKVFAGGKSIDASQEMIALGLCNIMGSFVGSFPTTASFSRTALNASSGVKTPVGGIFAGALVLLTLGVLTDFFEYVPKATLSAVILATVIFMVEYEMVPHLWKTKKSDLFVLLVTFISCIFAGAEYGILIGIAISIIVLLYNTARPTIVVEKASLAGVEYIIVQPDRTLYYPAIEYLKYRVNKRTMDANIPVVFDGAHLSGTDYTVAQGIKQMTSDFKKRNQKLVFTNLQQEVVDIIDAMKPEEFQHCRTKEEIEIELQSKFPGATLSGVRQRPSSGGEGYSTERRKSTSQSLGHIAQILFPEDYHFEMVDKEVQVNIADEELMVHL